MKLLAIVQKFLPLTRKELIAASIVFVAYFVAAKLGLYIYYAFQTSPALIWPPVGIALVAVLGGGYRMWVPIFLAQYLALITQNPNVQLIAFIIAVGFALQAVIGVYVLKRLGFDPIANNQRNILTLVCVAFGATMIEPLIITAAQTYLGTLSISPAENFFRGWGGGIFSVLIIVPVVTVWHAWSINKTFKQRAHYIELFGAFGLLFAVNYLMFWTPYARYFGIAVIFFLPAVLIWFALRFTPRWMTLALFLTSIIAIAGTLIAHASSTPLNLQLLNVQIYIGLVAAIFLIFAAIVEERRVAFERLEQLYRSTASADEAKNEFIAVLAHELRNPLSPLVNSLELLKLQPQTKESVEAIETAEELTVMIRRMLDDLLDTVRLSQKKFKLQKSTTSLREILEYSLLSTKDFLQSRGHTLLTSMPDQEIMLEVDSVRVKQIVINLLLNAYKYTEPGGKVDVRAEKRDGYILIEITDTGVGFDRESRKNLFQPFKQFAPSGDRGTGLGIGLYLTKRLVEMHDGKIEAHSEGAGRGSTFRVYLPLALQMSIPHLDKKRIPAKNSSIPRILIVDDNKKAGDTLQKLLAHYGYTVEVAYSGKEGLQKVEKFKPEVVFLDLGMPEMDGYEVAKQLQTRPWDGYLVALSGYGQETDREQSRKAGFYKHLVKPISTNELLTILASLSSPKSAPEISGREAFA